MRVLRIVSLIPEATEILHALGFADEVMVVSPEDMRDLDRLSSILRAAAPALVFTSETSAGDGMPRHLVRRLVAMMRPQPRPSVYALEPHSLGEILSDVKTVGDAVGRQATARVLIETLRARIDAVSLRSALALADGTPRRIVCLHRADPPLAAGGWLAELVGLAGGLDALDGLGRPPRAVSWDAIRAAEPELVVCPGAFVRSGADGPLHPGPGAVDMLERLAALILPPLLPRT